MRFEMHVNTLSFLAQKTLLKNSFFRTFSFKFWSRPLKIPIFEMKWVIFDEIKYFLLGYNTAVVENPFV